MQNLPHSEVNEDWCYLEYCIMLTGKQISTFWKHYIH